MVTERETNYCVFADICVVHPKIDASVPAEPLKAAIAAEKAKFKRYCDNYQVQEAQIKSLVFETFGGWTEGTYEYLYNVVKGIAGTNDQLFTKLWRKLRNRIGVTLARGEGELLSRLNALNPSVQCSQSPTSSTPLTPTTSGSLSRPTSRRGTPSRPKQRTSRLRTIRSDSRSSTSSSDDLPTTPSTTTTITTTTRQRLRRESNSNSSPGGNAVDRMPRGSA